MKIPESGRSKEAILSELKNLKREDANWRDGKTFSYVYFAGEDVLDLTKAAYEMYFSENALNPTAFQSLRKMETEVIKMAADLFRGDQNIRGSLTSGGTESILMAVKTARSWAAQNRPEIGTPEIVLAANAHPAFHKACHYFKVKATVVPVDENFRANQQKMQEAIGPNAVMLVASAPAYPQGGIDPVIAIAALAKKNGLLCHVDACVGGFFLPFLRQLHPELPAFDFSVDGVTSISADIHKYGYAAKGASLILYKNEALRKAQFYVYTQWSGGIYASPTMTGTRPGGAIAAAWAVLNYLGHSGYMEKTKIAIDTFEKIKKGVETIPELTILGQPSMTIMAIASEQLDIYEVGDELGVLGWTIDRQQLPPSLHLTITPAHKQSADQFLIDLQEAVQKVKQLSMHGLSKKIQVNAVKGLKKVLPESLLGRFQSFAARHSNVGGKRSAAMYGMMGELNEEGNLDEMVKSFLDKLMR